MREATEMVENEAYTVTKNLAEEIKSQAPDGSPLNFWSVSTTADPVEVFDRLAQSPVAELLLAEGASLGIEDSTGHYPNLELYARREMLSNVALKAFAYTIPQSAVRNYDVELQLGYVNGSQTATQSIGIETFSNRSEKVPVLYRRVVAPEYLESGYEGHNYRFLQTPTAQQVMAFVAIANEVYQQK